MMVWKSFAGSRTKGITVVVDIKVRNKIMAQCRSIKSRWDNLDLQLKETGKKLEYIRERAKVKMNAEYDAAVKQLEDAQAQNVREKAVLLKLSYTFFDLLDLTKFELPESEIFPIEEYVHKYDPEIE